MLLNSYRIIRDRKKRFGWQSKLKTQMDKISVIVPVFNESEYIDTCIESIRNQTYSNLEIIIVDDHSSDDSLEKCKQYAIKDRRIIILSHDVTMGAAAAKSSGLAVATGEYVAFVNGDDMIEKNMIEQLKRLCETNRAEISVCDITYLYNNDMIKRSKYANGDTEVLSGKEFDSCYFLYPDMSLENVAIWNKLFRRRLFEGVEFPDKKIRESEFITFKLFNKSEKVAYLHEPLYFCRQDIKDTVGTDFSNKEYDVFDAYVERMNYYEENGMYDMLLHTLKRHMYWLCEYKTKAKISNCYEKSIVDKYTKAVKEVYKRNKLYLPMTSREKKQFLLFGISFNLYYTVREMQ